MTPKKRKKDGARYPAPTKMQLVQCSLWGDVTTHPNQEIVMRLSSSLHRMLVFVFVPAACLVGACASVPVEDGFAPTTRESAPRYVVTASEIEATGLSSAFDALRRVRPEMLTRRANVAPQDPYQGMPVLYVDRVLQGKVDLLITVPAVVVREIRYYPPVAARHEVGAFHPGGVISVITRR